MTGRETDAVSHRIVVADTPSLIPGLVARRADVSDRDQDRTSRCLSVPTGHGCTMPSLTAAIRRQVEEAADKDPMLIAGSH